MAASNRGVNGTGRLSFPLKGDAGMEEIWG
jgi:hypothetical protein